MSLSRTPLILIIKPFFFGLVGLLFLSYVTYQARYILTGPVITLSAVPQTKQSTRVVEIAGTAENITEITVNDRKIVTDESGNFLTPVVLENGYTIVSIAAQDRYGRTTNTEVSFVYVPQSSLVL